MNLHQQFLTNNDCYKAGRKITVKKLMLHSTGANNPKLSRYVAPDDGILGTPSSAHWNQPDIEKCVHGFIGLTKDGDVATYQTLPWNHRGWHAGGSANNTHIGVEICEGDLEDGEYFAKVYKEAVELFAFLAKEYNLDPMEDIETHSEGHRRGVASNHSDVMHWFPKHGKSMDTFRADVRALINGETVQTPNEPVSKPSVQPTTKSVEQLAQEVIAGKHGTGAQREKALGSQYNAVQSRVNELLSGSSTSTPTVAPKPAPTKSVDQLAQEVIAGKHGTGDARRKALGSQFDAVQSRVNELLGASSKKTTQSAKSISQLADEVIKGLHGSGRDRMRSLGSNYAAVQKEVNKRLR